MRNQLIQVLKTYAKRLHFWILFGVWLFLQIWGMPRLSSTMQIVSQPSFGAIWFIYSLVGIALGMQIKSQFANPRARLFPNFCTAHLLVAGVLIATLMVVSFVLSIFFTDLCPIAIPAFGLFILAFSFLVTNSVQKWSGCFLFPLVVLPMMVPLSLIHWMANPYWPLWLAVFCFGLAGLAFLGLRLTKLSEGRPEYAWHMLESPCDVTSLAGKRDRRQFEAQAIARSRIWVRLCDLQFHLQCRSDATSSPWRRLWMRQLTNGFEYYIIPLVMMTFILFMVFIQREQPLAHDTTYLQGKWEVFLVGVFVMPIFLGLPGISLTLLRQWPQRARESLFPLNRKDFVRDLFRSTAFDVALLAIAHCVGLSLGLFLWDTHSLYIGQLPWLLLAAIAQYLVVYALISWLSTFHSTFMYSVACMGLYFSGMLFARWQFHFIQNDSWLAPIIAAELVASLPIAYGLYRLAWRRWLQLDLA